LITKQSCIIVIGLDTFYDIEKIGRSAMFLLHNSHNQYLNTVFFKNLDVE